ncbi:hypothetical protein TCAL_15802 [Tigriopus californicus]|uniref:Uncharacterized protein n=1 Tax=Tigriopus californicus TaxID=6832 RepID=A0A553NPN8_TIGCA|nr:hypothetical protein TCAL_15802 [Tigriopus californicus]
MHGHGYRGNQILPVATRSNGTSVFIREKFIQQVESAILYGADGFHEFIPSDSPLQGMRMILPDAPMGRGISLMDFSWGFHLCHNILKSCYRWYFGTDKWIPMPSMNHPHAEIRDMIKLDRTWWILGGFNAVQQIGSVNYPHQISEYMSESGRWFTGSNYLGRYHEGLAKVSNRTVLAVGGSLTSARLVSAVRDVNEFNVLTGDVSDIGLTACPIFGITCTDLTAQNGTRMILCLGGYCPGPSPEYQSKVYVLNLETRDWKEMPQWEFPETIRFATIFWLRGVLFVIRALYEESETYTVYKFDETLEPVWSLVELSPDHPNEFTRVVKFNRSVIIVGN